MRMPRFLQSFRRRERGVQPDYVDDHPVSGYSDAYDYDQFPRSGSRWRNMLSKRGRPRDVVYVDGAGDEYMVPSSDVGRAPIVDDHLRRPTSRRARPIEGYSDSSITDSDSLPVRFPRQGSETQYVQGAVPQPFDHEPAPYMQRVPSHESFHHQEPVPPPLDHDSSTVPPLVAPPGEVYREESTPPLIRENVSEYTQDPSLVHGERRRFRARRGEPITVGGVRIEVNDDSRHRRHRRHRSRSRSVDSYSSGSSRSYTSSSSFEEQPIIISADPHTQIEIGNERDGFVPYEQYLADHETRRRGRRRHHRRTPEEEIYVVPAGANVIFVDEDGRELHRVGDFDGRYSRRRNSRARTTRQVPPKYEAKESPTKTDYVECAIQTDCLEVGGERGIPTENEPQDKEENNSAVLMHKNMRQFMESRPTSPSPPPFTSHGDAEDSKIFHPSRIPLHQKHTLFRPPSPPSFQTRFLDLKHWGR